MGEQTIDLKRTARFAGVLYLAWVLTGLYGMLYVPSQTIVPGDAAATAEKILRNEFIFRTGIFTDIISITISVFMLVALYRLFREVNERQAKLMVAFLGVTIPAAFIMDACSFTSLMLFKGELLKTAEVSQRNEMAMLFLKISDYGILALEMFWGLWLIPFGQLVYKSKFIPRIIGIFLLLNGVAYVIQSTSSVLFPDYQEMVKRFGMPFWVLGEISIMLWLLIKGTRVPPVHPGRKAST